MSQLTIDAAGSAVPGVRPGARCWLYGQPVSPGHAPESDVRLGSASGSLQVPSPLGDRGLWQKFQFYEGSCGVPLIVRAPGVTSAGTVCPMPVNHIGLLPTLAELCGVALPGGLDGNSFLEQVRSPAATRPATIFAEYALRSRGAKYMIRRGDLKYTFRTHDKAELYDLANDPGEMRDLTLEPGSAARVQEMKDALFAWYRPPELAM